MKRYPETHSTTGRLLSLALTVSLALPLPSLAASISLATAPLANSTTASVLPNLMFILDNSGSMGQDYTPDYISDIWNSPATADKNCRDGGDNDGNTTVYPGVASGSTRILDLCVVGDPPYMNSDMNSQYYNPAIRYEPGYNPALPAPPAGSTGNMPSQSTPTSVLTDAYNKQNKDQLLDSHTSVNLTTSYPDRVWCTTQIPTAANLIDPAVCRKNSDYLYPNATFKYGRTSGSPNQQVTATMLDSVIKVSGAPYYYSVVPTEYCTAADLKTCILSSVSTGSYTFPAKSRWCSDTALTNCQATKTATYTYPRFVGVNTTAVAASGGKFRVGNSTPRTITNVKFGGSSIEIMDASVTGISRVDLATKVAAQINSYASNPDFTASVCSTDYVCLTSTTAAGASGNGSFSVIGSAGSSNFTNTSGGVTGASTPPYTFTRTDIVSTTTTYPKVASRADCSGTVGASGCTYAEEITNFGNWYAYYRTRMQAMKSAASRAFKPIDNRYRVGFITIASQSSAGNYLPIDTFITSQKTNWYSTLFAINPSSSTPLRSALSIVGRIFAGQKPVGSSDPVQYSCQQNFALLTTDGYWNTDSAADVKNLSGGTIGNMDGGSTPRPMYEGPTASSASLADAAKYYYDTDLRTSALGNCTGALGVDVCDNNVFVSGTDNNVKQHMTTFTLGLGVDGTLAYTSDYKTATSGDFYNLGTPTRAGIVNWPVPVEGNETTVDDLWHAAVNGQGTYFSAKDPAQLTNSLSEALTAIGAKIGAGAAAATSTLNPVTGDNFAYVASYTTVKWTGNLEARSINISTGAVSEDATWCAEDVVAGTCAAPSNIAAETSGSSTVYYCVTPSATTSTCPAPGILDGTNCKVEVATSCTGTMAAKVGTASDTRTIKMNVAGALQDFTYANLVTAGVSTNFQSAFLGSNLSQWSSLSPTQQPAAAGANLVNFLRGQKGFEDRASNTAENRLYRYREAVLGDAVEAKPAYIGKPTFSYTDPGYAAFKAANASRAGTVYMGTNDGMLHAFDASNGQERWAYVPSMVIPNLWKLADKNYSIMHAYYVNGSPTIYDICSANCTDTATAIWRTILVGGLNGGGRGYYALDITDPAAPTLMWEFTTANDGDLGYTFGNPVITKKADGTWVVLITSGYNNTTGSNPGKGFLYVLNPMTGAIISKLGTGVGDATTPSGLAKISAWVDDGEKNNTAGYTYGGDLLGNLWRFDINAAASATNPLKLATLFSDAAGTLPQPITTRPELGKINNKRVVYVGTGKYLETLDLTNTQQQTLYAIKDDNAMTTLANPRTTLVQQTLTTSGANRTVPTTNPVDFNTGMGWYVDFPDIGERQNVDGQLVMGTLLTPTTVPSNTVCSPGGYGWLNYFNYQTGGGVNTTTNLVSSKTNAPIVGINVIYISGVPIVSTVTADHPTPELVSGVPFTSMTSGFQQKRVIWRELIP